MDLSALQFMNAVKSMVVNDTLFCIVIDNNPVQPKNVEILIIVTKFGIVIEYNDIQRLKAAVPTWSTP